MSEVPSSSKQLTLRKRVEEIFDPERGALARTIDAFEPREGQREMAINVADVLGGGGTLLAEAGTGTGKTLAYLVPALLSGHRVLVSTGTKNLQEQLYFKDLPLLGDALGKPVKAAYMKGRSNYLCLHRFAAVCDDPSPRPAADRAYLTDLKEWVTEFGDRAELENLPDDLPLWNDVSATQENCLGRECPQYDDCFVTKMRQNAAQADIVIVNHHLLCADAAIRENNFGEVIPDYSYAVIDEAHQLEGVATHYFGKSVSTFRLDDLTRDGSRLVDAGILPDPAETVTIRDALGRVRNDAGAFFAALQTERRGSETQRGNLRLRIDAEMLRPIEEGPGHALLDALTMLQSECARLPDPPEDLHALARRAGEIHNDLRFILRPDDPDYVYILEIRNRAVSLRASPINVSKILPDKLWKRLHGSILTSATLAVDKTFDYVKSRLGVASAYEFRVKSDFDFEQQAILYLPRRMPAPRTAAFTAAAAKEIIEILKRTAGRAFVLFTSYATLHGVWDLVATAGLEFPLLVQGTAPRSVLLRDFRQTPNAVLLGTSSFWQGVDVVGDALSCVIIDKLPFASPGDPITEARIKAIAERGDDPFADYQVPLAILALQQGLGRLIRHRADRGVLAILDPRIRTKAYGQRFLDSLPPAPRTHDIAEVGQFFESMA